MVDKETQAWLDEQEAELVEYCGMKKGQFFLDVTCPKCGQEMTRWHDGRLMNPRAHAMYCPGCKTYGNYTQRSPYERYPCKECTRRKPVTKDETFGYSKDGRPVAFCALMESFIFKGDCGDESCFIRK